MSSALPHTDEKYTYREGWRWSPSIREWFHTQLSSLTNPPGRPVLHVCSGKSRLGDIRIDILPTGDVQADALNLPLADDSIPTIVSDPPYDWALQHRIKYFQELGRVHEPGGLLLHKAPWLPLEGLYDIQRVVVANNRHLPRNVHQMARSRRRVHDAPRAESPLEVAPRA